MACSRLLAHFAVGACPLCDLCPRLSEDTCCLTPDCGRRVVYVLSPFAWPQNYGTPVLMPRQTFRLHVHHDGHGAECVSTKAARDHWRDIIGLLSSHLLTQLCMLRACWFVGRSWSPDFDVQSIVDNYRHLHGATHASRLVHSVL